MFRNSDDARVELSLDRVGFLQRRDIMALIPSHIRRRIHHPGGVAQVEGFQDLLILLNLDPDAELRRLIIDYFNSSPTLPVQLGSYMSPPLSSSRDAQASSVGRVVPSGTYHHHQSSSSSLQAPSATSDQYQLGSFFPC